MSENPPPPQAAGPAAVPAKVPAKVPMKLMVAKIALTNVAVKLPAPAGGAVATPGPAALAKFASVIPSRVSAPPMAVAAKVAPPKPVVKPPTQTASKPLSAPTKPAPLKRGRADDDDDDFAALGVPKPSPVVKKQPAPSAPRPAPRAAPVKTLAPSSSDDDEDLDEESCSLFARASQKGLVPVANADELLKEEDEAPAGPAVPPRPPIQKFFTADIDSMIDRLQKKIASEEAKLRIKDDNKTISLSTSKVNYIDPRIVIAWCKREKMPISKVFTASLQKKFPWAMNIDEAYEF